MSNGAVSPWLLLSTGRYREAIAAYTALINAKPTAPDYNNRGTVYLALRDYAAAAGDFRASITRNPGSDFGYQLLGVSQWCNSQPVEAVQTWRQGLGAEYTDAAGGVELPGVLLYAAARLGDEVLRAETTQLLRRLSHRKSLMHWPGALVPYLLDRMTDGELQTAAVRGESVPILLHRHQCQVEFYGATRALLHEDQETFRARMGACVHTDCQFLEPVYFLARWEIDQAFPNMIAQG